MSTITTYVCLCPKVIVIATQNESPMTLKYEKCKSVLFSILVAVCARCNKEFSLETSKRQGSGLSDLNVRDVWGTMSNGGGASDLQEQRNMRNPPLTSNMFSSVEHTIGDWWSKPLKDEMLKAGAEGRRIAIEKGICMTESPILE